MNYNKTRYINHGQKTMINAQKNHLMVYEQLITNDELPYLQWIP